MASAGSWRITMTRHKTKKTKSPLFSIERKRAALESWTAYLLMQFALVGVKPGLKPQTNIDTTRTIEENEGS